MSRVWNVNLLSHKRVGAALQATVETLYTKQDAMERKLRRRGCGLIVNVEE